MDLYSGHINRLIDELSGLPGIGSKSAQRLAFHLVNLPQDKVKRLVKVIMDAKENVRYCKECFTLTDSEICPVCANAKRDHNTIMVVENTKRFGGLRKDRKIRGHISCAPRGDFSHAGDWAGRH